MKSYIVLEVSSKSKALIKSIITILTTNFSGDLQMKLLVIGIR